MFSSELSPVGTVTLEQLIALNDEIAALVRAGVPLEQGLGHLAHDMPGRLGKISARIAERLGRGEALDKILADPAMGIPAVYRAVVEAGMRSGRLPAALESVARSTRWLSECRRMVVGAFIYPLVLFLVGWASFVWFALKIAPGLADSMEAFGAFGRGAVAEIARWGQSVEYWGPAVPLVVLMAAAVWWFRSGRANLVGPRSAGLGWVPWMRGVLRSLRIATFVEVLATLVENRVPLPEALELAAETSGDRQFREAARRLAEAVRQGQPLREEGGWVGRGLPPLVRWLIGAGQQRGVLLHALREAADNCRRRAEQKGEMARLYVPVLATVIIGGSFTALHALLVFGSWGSLLRALVGFGGGTP